MPKFTETPRMRLTRRASEESSTHTGPPAHGRLAAAPTGLYGSTKAIQRAAEAASRKLARHALKVAKRAFAKDEQVVPFLQAHAKREKSKSAQVLLAAMREIGPKLASEMRGGIPKEAGAAEYGLYGFKARTADLGLDACKEVRAHAGRISADLHRRRGTDHGAITGFYKEHCKTAKCAYSGLLLSCYPDADAKVAGGTFAFGSPVGFPTITAGGRVDEPVQVFSSFPHTVSGHLREVEIVPNEFRSFRLAALKAASSAGAPPTNVSFKGTILPGRFVLSAGGSEDRRSLDAEGEVEVKASWEGGEVAATLAYTAEFEPLPKKGDWTMLASGDYVEWEE